MTHGSRAYRMARGDARLRRLQQHRIAPQRDLLPVPQICASCRVVLPCSKQGLCVREEVAQVGANLCILALLERTSCLSSSFSRLGLPESSSSPSSRSSLGTTYLALLCPQHASAWCCQVTKSWRWRPGLSQTMMRVPAHQCSAYQATLKQPVDCVCTVRRART